MKNAINIFCLVSLLITIISCGLSSNEIAVNKVLQTLLKQQHDSNVVYFKSVDSDSTQKFKKVTKVKDKSDSLAIYYKSVDSLRIPTPVTKNSLREYDLIGQYDLDSLVSDNDLKYWNRKIATYSPRVWEDEEKESLPIIFKKPSELEEFYSPNKDLSAVLFYSKPIFNKKGSKALVYQLKISRSGQVSQLYILSKGKNNWNIVYRGNVYTATH